MKVQATSYGLPRDEGGVSSDAFAVRVWDQTVMAVLCDGAGTGAPAREAAQRAVASLVEQYSARPRSWGPAQALAEFTALLNLSFYQESMARYDRPEMVSTLAVVVIEGDRLHGLNAGDSRVMLWREGELRLLSVDQVDVLHKNMLVGALGMTEEIDPHAFEAGLKNGDIVFLCSDGLSNHLDEAALNTELGCRCSARLLVLAARELASRETLDDTSAIVIEIQQTGQLRTMAARRLSIPESLVKGQVIDGYELVRPFQGTDRVWLAEKDKQRFVLKFAPLEAVDSTPHLDAFTMETWNATRTRSDHFVRAFEPLGQTARYYVMEFIDAPSLAAVLRERLLSVDSAISLGVFLTDACQTLLRLDLAHGDLKPENILCAGDYARLTFKLVDLGSASRLFSVTSRAGTASYLAPERFHGAPLSERTEVFAIGVTLYQTLTGTLPYGLIERFQTPVFDTAKRLRALNPNIPDWLDHIIRRAISLKPERRYQHFSELAHDLAHPDRVQPCYDSSAPLLERAPLLFYKVGFFVFLITTVLLGLKLLLPS